MWVVIRHLASGRETRGFQVSPDIAMPAGLNVTVIDGTKVQVQGGDGRYYDAKPGYWIVDGAMGSGVAVIQRGFDADYAVIPPDPPQRYPNIIDPALIAQTDTPLIFLQRIPVGSRTVLEFNRGEGLPVHVHTQANNHFTVVESGALICHGRPAIEGETIKAGDILSWIVGEPHGFTALEDGTIIVQIASVTSPTPAGGHP